MISLVDTWISQASAKQRAGRAGRVRPGVCFRLYTRVRYGDMPAYTTPEIQRVPLEDLCLHLLATRTGHPVRVLAHALDPPKRSAVMQALETLRRIGATREEDAVMGDTMGESEAAEAESRLATASSTSQSVPQGAAAATPLVPLVLTPLGRCLSRLPLDVHLGKMLVMATLLECLEPALTIAAALSYQLPFVAPFEQREAADAARRAFDGGMASDLIAVARAYAQWRTLRERGAEGRRAETELCRRHYLSAQRLGNIERARRDLRRTLAEIKFASRTEPRVTEQLNGTAVARLRCVILAGLYPQVARADPPVASRSQAPPLVLEGGGTARLHPSSALHPRHRRPWMHVRHVAFAEKVKTAQVSMG